MVFSKLKKSLLFLTTIFFFSGCNQNYEYYYKGSIDNEEIKSYKNIINPKWNVLKIKKEDGTKIKYEDLNNDLEIDFIKIKKDDGVEFYINKSKKYHNLEKFEEHQKIFESYLEKIIKEKI